MTTVLEAIKATGGLGAVVVVWGVVAALSVREDDRRHPTDGARPADPVR